MAARASSERGALRAPPPAGRLVATCRPSTPAAHPGAGDHPHAHVSRGSPVAITRAAGEHAGMPAIVVDAMAPAWQRELRPARPEPLCWGDGTGAGRMHRRERTAIPGRPAGPSRRQRSCSEAPSQPFLDRRSHARPPRARPGPIRRPSQQPTGPASRHYPGRSRPVFPAVRDDPRNHAAPDAHGATGDLTTPACQRPDSYECPTLTTVPLVTPRHAVITPPARPSAAMVRNAGETHDRAPTGG